MRIMHRNCIRLLGAALLIGGAGQAASAADNCIVVVGTDSGGPHITMDPAFINTDDDAYHQYAVYNRLISVDEKMQLQPELASSWEVSKDGLTWTFHLVKCVTFHDSRPFTSKDVAYTFKRLIDPATGSPAASTLPFLDPNGIKAVDDSTVTFTTKSPIANLPNSSRSSTPSSCPTDRKAPTLKLHGIGTGPFMQQSFTPSETKRPVRNPHYWKPGLPKASA